MQAETLASAYRLWRRNWKGKGKEYTAGALVWQVSVRNTYTIRVLWLLARSICRLRETLHDLDG